MAHNKSDGVEGNHCSSLSKAYRNKRIQTTYYSVILITKHNTISQQNNIPHMLTTFLFLLSTNDEFDKYNATMPKNSKAT